MNLKLAVCAILGHSNIETYCFGYVSCARCKTQVGDTIAGTYKNDRAVFVAHDCPTCRANFKRLTWKDRIFVRDPRPTKKEIEAQVASQKVFDAWVANKESNDAVRRP